MAINAIGGIAPTPSITKLPSSSAAGEAGGASFGDALQGLLKTVESSTGDANQKVGQMLDGTGDVHEAMIALQHADTMFQLTVQIKNKLVQAYQDVMRMSV
jgi:flagellar hook-basal body complex protein FliE